MGKSHLSGRSRASGLLVALVWLMAACGAEVYEERFKAGDIDIYDDLYAVSVADDKTAVAAGYMGAIYTTADAGSTWVKSKRDEGPRRLYYGVSMADPLRGWIVGQLGTVLRSAFRSCDLVARLGGDEFVVLVEGDLQLAQPPLGRLARLLEVVNEGRPRDFPLAYSVGAPTSIRSATQASRHSSPRPTSACTRPSAPERRNPASESDRAGAARGSRG